MSKAVLRSDNRIAPQVARWSARFCAALGQRWRRERQDGLSVLGGCDRHLLNDIGVSWCEITTARPALQSGR